MGAKAWLSHRGLSASLTQSPGTRTRPWTPKGHHFRDRDKEEKGLLLLSRMKKVGGDRGSLPSEENKLQMQEHGGFQRPAENRKQETYRAKFQAGRGPLPVTAFPWTLGLNAGGTCEGRACERTHPPGPSRGAFPKDMGRQESVRTPAPRRSRQI